MNAATGDRFANLPALPARLVLALLALVLALSAWTPVTHTDGIVGPAHIAPAQTPPRPRDFDLALYDRVIERLRGGENYYDFIAEEQRKAEFPLRPAVAVRLPTLAYIDAWLGDTGQSFAAVALLLAVIAAWWRRLGTEPGASKQRVVAIALLLFGASLGTARYFFTLHELWAGMLLALAFALHRPGKWVASLAVAALAVAIREHALPFILLMAAMALWRRDWKEGAAWSLLAAAFFAALAVHIHMVNAMVVPSDGLSKPWMALRGLTGWTSSITLSSNLRFLPHWLAGPIVILCVFGWCAWKSPAGAFGALLYLGYGVLFMLAGRPDNYYWGFMVTPALFIGLALAPNGIASLLASARAK